MKNYISTSILSIGLLGSSFYTQAQPKLVETIPANPKITNIPYHRYQLDNGLTLVIHEDHSDPLVHVDVTYHVGSAREQVGKSGFAHFFEHMMFQGSDNVGDEEHFRIITEAGGVLNGTTNRDRTNYFETVPKNQLEKMLWLEADRMGFLLDAVTQQKFEIQRATVKNERGQNYDNRPYGLVWETTSRNLYPYGHPYSWLTIGYVEDLNRVDVNDLKDFFLRWYGPNNAVLTVGGNVNKEEVLQMVEKYFGGIPRGPKVENMDPYIPSLEKHRFVSMVDQFAKIPMLRIVYPGAQQYTRDAIALDCLSEIIGSGTNSLLYQNLVKNQKAVDVSAYYMANELSGEFTMSVMPMGDGKLTDMYDEVDKIWKQFETRGVKDVDLEKYKASAASSTIYRLESVSGKVSSLAAFHTYTGSPNFLPTYLSTIYGLTKADVMNAYNKYIKNKGAVVLSVATKADAENIVKDDKYVPDEKGYKAPDYGYEGLVYSKAKDEFDRKKMPSSAADIEVTSPKIFSSDIKKIPLIGTVSEEIPVVNLLVSFESGKINEPENKIGLNAMFASMMEEGTQSKTTEQFDEALEVLGSEIQVRPTFNGIDFVVRSLATNLDKTLKLLEEKILTPKFDQSDLDRNKAQTIEGIKNDQSRPVSVASSVLVKLLYGENVFGYSPDEQSIKNITLTDINNYYKKFITQTRASVVLVSPLDESIVKSKLAFLNKLPKGYYEKIVVPTPKSIVNKKDGKQTIYFVHFPKAAQTEFRIASLTDMMYDATGDYYKSGIMNYPLGGAFNSRLNLFLREEKGWTYGARSSFSGNKFTGAYAFSGGILAAATDSAFYDVMRIINDYKKNGITAEEIAFTKNAKLQAEARDYETGFQKLSYLQAIQLYRLPYDYTKTQTNILKNITQNEVNDLISKRLPSNEDLLILLVGDKERISERMMKDYSIIYLDKEGNEIK